MVRFFPAGSIAAAFIAIMATGAAHAGEIVVSAAASLTNAFKDIARAYETQYAGSKVSLNVGASGALLQQMAKGAPVDVFAAADQETMDQAVRQQLVQARDRQDFVRNSLVLIVPADSRAAIEKPGDLARPEIKRIAIGNPASVPAGRYTRHALEAARLWSAVEPKMIGTQNVRQSLDYVARGEVDAGFVYVTDAALMKDKVRVAFDVPLDTAIRYPIAKAANSANPAEASRFIAFVLSPPSQAILARYGFGKP